jgi:hypothetical protein
LKRNLDQPKLPQRLEKKLLLSRWYILMDHDISEEKRRCHHFVLRTCDEISMLRQNPIWNQKQKLAELWSLTWGILSIDGINYLRSYLNINI